MFNITETNAYYDAALAGGWQDQILEEDIPTHAAAVERAIELTKADESLELMVECEGRRLTAVADGSAAVAEDLTSPDLDDAESVRLWVTDLHRSGRLFHLEDDASEIVSLETGERLWTDQEVADLNVTIEHAYAICDPLEFAVACFDGEGS